jgi:hypothetical protein
VNRLDDEGGGKTAAKTLTDTPGVLEVPVRDGGPSRSRTLDRLIKSDSASLPIEVHDVFTAFVGFPSRSGRA